MSSGCEYGGLLDPATAQRSALPLINTEAARHSRTGDPGDLTLCDGGDDGGRAARRPATRVVRPGDAQVRFERAVMRFS